MIALTDERPQVLGAAFTLDPDKMAALAIHVGLSPEDLDKIQLHLIDVDPEAEHRIGGMHEILTKSEHPDEGQMLDVVLHVIHLRVSDRVDYSEKSLIRINRNFCHALRTLSYQKALNALTGDAVAAAEIMYQAAYVWQYLAYRSEQAVKTDANLRPLTPVL